MSTASGSTRARSLVPSVIARPRLTIVPKVAAKAPRVPFVILVVLVMGLGLVGLLLVNTALQRGAYDLQELRSRSDELARTQQALELQVADLRQPQRVAKAALGLGMVGNPAPAFLHLEDGSITGKSTPAKASDSPVIGLHAARLPGQIPKLMPALAGAGASASTGVTHVPQEHPRGGPRVQEQGTRQDRSTDTRAGSRPQEAQRVTNNSSNSG
jgi:hypothetical protein